MKFDYFRNRVIFKMRGFIIDFKVLCFVKYMNKI